MVEGIGDRRRVGSRSDVSTRLAGTCRNLQVPIEHVSAVLRTLGILRRIYAGFRKKFPMRFRRHFVSLSAREERGEAERRREQPRGGLLRDLRRPIAAVTTAHYHQSHHHHSRRGHLIETDERGPINSTSNLAPQETVRIRVPPPPSHAMTRRFLAKFIFNAPSDKRSEKTFRVGIGRKRRQEIKEIIHWRVHSRARGKCLFDGVV